MKEKLQNSPINIVKIKESDLKKYTKIKEGQDFKINDLIHLIDDEYVKILDGNILLTQKVNKYNVVLRKK